jgi:cell wall-associated NlpC family hydrolase
MSLAGLRGMAHAAIFAPMPALLRYRLCRWSASLAAVLALCACAGLEPATTRSDEPDGTAADPIDAPRPATDGGPPDASARRAPAVSGGPSSGPAPQDAAKAPDASSNVVIAAMGFLDVRYRRGGESAEQGFDCSGFTRHVYASSADLLLPRRAQDQARAPALRKVAQNELEPGDLVFFNTQRAAYSHVGIYVGEGRFIHAPRSGAQVRVEDMRSAYWRKRYNGARRAAGAGGVPDAAQAAPSSPGMRHGPHAAPALPR